MFDSKLPFSFKVCSLSVKLNGVFVSYNIQIYHPPFSQHKVSNPSQTAIPYNLPLYASIQIFHYGNSLQIPPMSYFILIILFRQITILNLC